MSIPAVGRRPGGGRTMVPGGEAFGGGSCTKGQALAFHT
jgi:hypothetical protein